MSKKVDKRLKLSYTSKMPCPSWSLEAVTTCPGSRKLNGTLVSVCQGCYATTGFYMMPVVKAARVHNREDWKRTDWVFTMVQMLEGELYFRWFDSGDVYCKGLADKIYSVMKQTPDTQHWLPTRSHKIHKIKPVLTKMKRLRNVAVRYSSDNLDSYAREIHGSVVLTDDGIDSYTPRLEGDELYICGAYSREGKCGDCRTCWDKTINCIGYPIHGSKMSKVAGVSKVTNKQSSNLSSFTHPTTLNTETLMSL